MSRTIIKSVVRSGMSTDQISFKALNGQINIDEAQGIVECFVAAVGNKDSVGDVVATGEQFARANLCD